MKEVSVLFILSMKHFYALEVKIFFIYPFNVYG